MVVHAHARFSGIFAAGSDAAPGSPRRMHRGRFKILALCRTGDQRAEKKQAKLRLHRASIIITRRLLMVQSIWIRKIGKELSSAFEPATMSRCSSAPAA